MIVEMDWKWHYIIVVGNVHLFSSVLLLIASLSLIHSLFGIVYFTETNQFVLLTLVVKCFNIRLDDCLNWWWWGKVRRFGEPWLPPTYHIIIIRSVVASWLTFYFKIPFHVLSCTKINNSCLCFDNSLNVNC